MKLFCRVVLGASHLLLTVALCHAGSAHEMSVGAQKEQICSAQTIEVVGRFLKVDRFKIPNYRSDPVQEGIIIAAACKTNPANEKITIAAVSYETDVEYKKALVIAFVDVARGTVISSFKGEIGEDAAMKVESGSLWIDTAAYTLRSDVRAFGLDVTSGYISHCADGGLGALRSLYVQEGKTIRPILEDLYVSSWSFIQQGQSRCTGPDAPEETTTENFDLSISVDKASTNGYRDLVVTALASRDDGKRQKRKPFHFKLRYDGNKYPINEMQDSFWKWRS